MADTDKGALRRVGVEIEFAGLDVAAAAHLTQDVFGGAAVEESLHRVKLEDTEFGTFIIELDAQLVHKDQKAGQGGSKPVLPDDVDAAMRGALGKVVTGIVPVEIVTPPIPWPELGRLSTLADALRQAGAKGTGDNVLYAFGLHLNPELSALDAEAVTRHLRAYFVLADWLRAEISIDTTRRLMPHADPFPKDYMVKVLDPDYCPDQSRLIADYLDWNPTRNRELDMLPLFRHLDEDAVMARLDDPLIKARPTFHYRLPDCALADPGWTPVVEWNRWVKIEELAADGDRLRELARGCRDNLARPAPERWMQELQAWFDS
ncbi:MAG: amidoligase family protein [Rhodospirillales bacterium]